MTIEQFLKNPLKNLKPISIEVHINKLSFGFEAIQYINYPYDYKFEIGNLLGVDIEHLHSEMRTLWGVEPNVNLN